MSLRTFSKSPDNCKKRSTSPLNPPNKRTKIKKEENDGTKENLNNVGNILIWFRSDLRTNDNPALAQALELATSRRNGGSEESSTVIALFILSPKEFSSHNVGAIKVDFILRNLDLLSMTLWDRHRIPLLVKTSSTASNVISDLKRLCSKYTISDVFANQEFEVDESCRDNKLSTMLPAENVKFHLHQDQCVVKPGELKSKSSNSVYTVYSPFKRRWFEVVKASKDKYLTEAKALSKFNAPFNSDTNLKAIGIDKPDMIPQMLEGFEMDKEKKKHLCEIWPAGEQIGLENLHNFCSGTSKNGTAAITKYQTDRNFPNLEQGTSRLSPYLAVGALSTKQCIIKAMEVNGGKIDSGTSGKLIATIFLVFCLTAKCTGLCYS
jgi:deoxyribodipyrimidine photo-lyase